ncbi:hypothetical protein J4450_08115 [Candidatus Micrarchaeota archaeon]|nr:hypothetical protein [Candidatus Micrarchaeota archaeon]
MHEEKSNFMETIDSIRSAEQEADKIVKEAKEKADEILRKAKENISKMKTETEENCVSLKNSRLQNGRSAIEKEVESVIKKARQEADGLKSKKLLDKELSDILKSILE